MDKYTKVRVLGKGSFGAAILVQSKKSGEKLVVKEIDIAKMDAKERAATEQEAKVLMSLKHPNIVSCLDYFVERGKLHIVMDYCPNGDLYELVQKQRGRLLPEDKILDWFVQMCLAMKHVHDRKILHRDLKGQNIFMCAGSRMLKIGDFGVAKVLEGTMQLASTAVGTPYYLSPEICQGKSYNHKSDVWALGCILYELATLKHAFDAQSLKLLVVKIVRGSYPALNPNQYSADLRLLVDSMIQKDPKRRPSVNEILAKPFVQARIASLLSGDVASDEFSHTVLHGQRGMRALRQPGQNNEHPRRREEPRQQGNWPANRAPPGPPGPSASAQDAAERAAAMRAEETKRRAEDRERRLKENKEEEQRRELAAQKRKEREESAVRAREERQRRALELQHAEREDAARWAAEEAERARQEARRAREKRERDVAKREEERRMNEIRRQEFSKRQAEAARNRQNMYNDDDDDEEEVQIYVPERRSSSDRNNPEASLPIPRAPTDSERRQAYLDMKKEADRNRARMREPSRPEPQHDEDHGDLPLLDMDQSVAPANSPPRRQALSEEELEQQRRDAYFEMRAAAERNKMQALADVASTQEQYEDYEEYNYSDEDGDGDGGGGEGGEYLYTISEQESQEFAEMMENMRSLVMEEKEGSLGRAIEKEREEDVDSPPQQEPISDSSGEKGGNFGKFLLDGRTLHLPSLAQVGMEASVALRVEALREFLEGELGDDIFIKVYRKMESAKNDVDQDGASEEAALSEILQEIGPSKMGMISLIHQLIVCEDSMHEANR